jgi:chromosome partitioning protein
MVTAVANQKGGVGKTASAINLAVLLARRGHRVLAVDVDPQFAMTRRLGVQVSGLASTIVDVLAGWTQAGQAVLSGVHGIDVLPGTCELAGVELALASELHRETVLRDALAELAYDQVVIDTPSNLRLLTVNALVAADIVIAPVAAGDGGAAQGLAELRATITKLTRIRPTLQELAVIVTKVKRRRLIGELIDDTIAGLGLSPVARLPDRTAVEQADVSRTPIALAYDRLAHDLECRAVIA